jgi:hypothetical protein
MKLRGPFASTILAITLLSIVEKALGFHYILNIVLAQWSYLMHQIWRVLLPFLPGLGKIDAALLTVTLVIVTSALRSRHLPPTKHGGVIEYAKFISAISLIVYIIIVIGTNGFGIEAEVEERGGGKQGVSVYMTSNWEDYSATLYEKIVLGIIYVLEDTAPLKTLADRVKALIFISICVIFVAILTILFIIERSIGMKISINAMNSYMWMALGVVGMLVAIDQIGDLFTSVSATPG